jgi:hypothetical protein
MNREKKSFLKDILKELQEENIAIFAGAGMSAGSGFVNWAELLRPIAEELGLEVEKEPDLVTLAQYHCNENGNNRSQLNKRLIEEFSKDLDCTENHRILSRLPVHTYWTTNYDKLIEKSLTETGKNPDVKYTKDHLATTKPKRDAIVYKMHGDVDHPNDAVLTKDDYEKYHVKMEQYISTLKGDLISKTFIFIGFSFTDPNLDYILSRVRVAYEKNSRRHYCFLRNVQKAKGEDEADFQYRLRKQELFVADLGRFNIKCILIDKFDEITELLAKIESEYKKRTIFISGAAHEYGNWETNIATSFIQKLSSKLISNDYRIVSGFGLGVGSSVISGALEEIYMNSKLVISDQLILRPFPRTTSSSTPLKELWKTYREDMISHSGIGIFLFGNKEVDGKVINSNGMQEEYAISKKLNSISIPIGATGYMSKELWDKELIEVENSDLYSKNYKELFTELGDNTKSSDDLINIIMNLLKEQI